MTYTLTFRRRFSPFKKTFKSVVSHSHQKSTDKMSIHMTTGAVEILNWSKCEIHLGADWQVAFEQYEKERAQSLGAPPIK